MFNFKILFAFAVLIQCIMSMPQTLEDPVALEAVDDTAEDVVAPFVAIEGDQLSAEFRGYGGYGYGRPHYGGYGHRPHYGGYGGYGYGGYRRPAYGGYGGYGVYGGFYG